MPQFRQVSQNLSPEPRKLRVLPLRVMPRPKIVLSPWFVVRVKSGRERWARRMIERAGGDVFLPWVLEEGSTKEKPLFPGFAFVKGPAWYYLLSTPGVLAPLMVGEEPAFVSIRDFEALRDIAGPAELIDVARERILVGDRVRVIKGPLQMLWGVVQGHSRGDGLDRVSVLFKILGREFEVPVNRKDVTVQPHGGKAPDSLVAKMQQGRVRTPLANRRPKPLRSAR